MKYIKTYEQTNYKYKVGDYIVIDYDEVKMSDMKEQGEAYYDYNEDDMFGKIINITDETRQSMDLNPYIIKTFEDNEVYYLKEDEIERLMTPEEIIMAETKENTKKYNL